MPLEKISVADPGRIFRVLPAGEERPNDTGPSVFVLSDSVSGSESCPFTGRRTSDGVNGCKVLHRGYSSAFWEFDGLGEIQSDGFVEGRKAR
jgi:hypothetical protein